MIYRVRLWLWERTAKRLRIELFDARAAMREAADDYSGGYTDFEIWDRWRTTVEIIEGNLLAHEARKPVKRTATEILILCALVGVAVAVVMARELP